MLATGVFGGDVRLHTIGYGLLVIFLPFPCLAAALRISASLRLPRIFLFLIVVAVLGVASEFTFFLTMVSTTGAAVGVWLFVTYGSWQTLRGLSRAEFRQSLRQTDSWAPFAVTALAAFAYIAMLCVAVPGTGLILQSVMTWLTLPIDNALPHILALHIAAHLPPKPFVAEWLSSDRPPLQAGYDLLFSILTPFAPDSEPRYQALSTMLQATSFGVLYTLCRLCGCRGARSAAVVLLAVFSGFFFLNSLFVWPKLLAATYVVGSLCIFRAPGVLTLQRAAVMGILAALGFLSHSGVVFLIPILLLAWFFDRRRDAVSPFCTATLLALIVMVPWVWYQKVYDPPANRLLKWHLAGQIGLTSQSFLQTLYGAYARPLATIVEFKLDNLATPLGINSTHLAPRKQKDREFFFVRDALSALAAPYFAALAFVRSKRRTLRSASRLAWIALGGTVFWCLAIYLPASTVVHVGSYATMLLMFAVGGIVATEWLPVFSIVVLFQVADFATAWLPLVPLGDISTSGGFCGAALLAAIITLCAALTWKRILEEIRRAVGSLSGGFIQRYAIAHGREIGTVAAAGVIVVAVGLVLRQRMIISVPEVPTAEAATISTETLAPPRRFTVSRLSALSRRRMPPTLSLDTVVVSGRPSTVAGLLTYRTFPVRGNETVSLAGWAFDPITRRPAAGIVIAVNGRRLPAYYGVVRPDVATAYALPVLTDVGFSANVIVNDFSRGLNSLSIIVISSDRAGYYVSATRVRFDRE